MSKIIATYNGRFDVFGKLSNIKIQIISVPKQKNKIVMTGQGSFKNPNGSLLGVKKIMPIDYVKMYGLIISYQSRGCHQGGPMHNFKDVISVWSKDEKHIDKLLKFLEKHITKKKTRRTKKGGCGSKRKKKKTQKGGGKKWSPKPGYELSPEMLKCLRKPWQGSVPKKNTKNKIYECPMFVDRSKPFVLSGTNKAPKIQLDHYDACYEAMYKDCEKKTQKKTQKGGGKDLLTKLQIKNMQRLKQCESKAKNKSQKKKCSNEFNKRWSDYSKFLNKKSIRKGRNYADRRQYTPKQQREIIKQFF